MANEISQQIVLQATKGGDTLQCTAVGSSNMSGDLWDRKRTTLNGTEVQLSTIGNQGWIFIKAPSSNSDAILVGVKPSSTFIESQRIWPGQGVICRGGANVVWAKSLSGTQKVEYTVIES